MIVPNQNTAFLTCKATVIVTVDYLILIKMLIYDDPRGLSLFRTRFNIRISHCLEVLIRGLYAIWGSLEWTYTLVLCLRFSHWKILPLFFLSHFHHNKLSLRPYILYGYILQCLWNLLTERLSHIRLVRLSCLLLLLLLRLLIMLRNIKTLC